MSQIKASNIGATCTWCVKSKTSGYYVSGPDLGSEPTIDINRAYLWLSEAAAQKVADDCGKGGMSGPGTPCVVVRARP